jgi:ERCC4-related helicase
MIILLIFLASLFGGGSSGLVQDVKKPVKEYVQDAAKVKALLVLNEEMLDTEAAFQKDLKAAKESLAELNLKRQSSEAEFVASFTAIDQLRAAAREKIVADRFQMKALMTAEEWRKVYAPADSKP